MLRHVEIVRTSGMVLLPLTLLLCGANPGVCSRDYTGKSVGLQWHRSHPTHEQDVLVAMVRASQKPQEGFKALQHAKVRQDL